ncbi:MAG TPA: hypothetical protein VK797_22640 [Tepidisphaeraceae bacterium]|jgi:hypothetical protein|nr:hypothetical protein [Tepidisphaeraceae bacterium]
MKKMMPKVIYAMWDNEGTRDEFLHTSEDASELNGMDQSSKVGVYEFVGFAQVQNATTVIPPKSKRGKR